jgi:serine/threonine protein kinase
VYTLGLVLYEMLTGCLAFDLKTATETMLAQMMTAPQPPSTHNGGIPGELDGLVMRALAKNPSFRYQSMDELAAQLRRISAPRSLPHDRAPSPPAPRQRRDTPRGPTRSRLTPDQPTARVLRPPPRPQRKRAVAGAIVAVVLAALAGSIATSWTLHHGRQRTDETSIALHAIPHRSSSGESPQNDHLQLTVRNRVPVVAAPAAPGRIPSAATPGRIRPARRPNRQPAGTDPAAAKEHVPSDQPPMPDGDGLLIPSF